jgi:hypothetical protein
MTSSMFARLRRSAWAAAPRRCFTSGGTRSVSVAVLVCVRAKPSSLFDCACPVERLRFALSIAKVTRCDAPTSRGVTAESARPRNQYRSPALGASCGWYAAARGTSIDAEPIRRTLRLLCEASPGQELFGRMARYRGLSQRSAGLYWPSGGEKSGAIALMAVRERCKRWVVAMA